MDMTQAINGMTAGDLQGRRPPLAEPTVAASLARALRDLAVEKGADPEQLLARSGLEEGAFDPPDGRIPLDRYEALMRAGQALSGDPALALHFGEAFDMGDLSVVGLMGRSISSAVEGMELLNRYARLVVDVETEGEGRYRLVREGEAIWAIDTRRNPNAFPEITESSFARIAAMGRRFFPALRLFAEVRFTHEAPSYADEYARIFDVPLTFASDCNGLRLVEGWDRFDYRMQPRFALDIYTAHADGLLEKLDSKASLRGRVEALLAADLPHGPARVATIAAELGLGEMTLSRRLKAEGTSFEAVLDGLRHRLAIRFLRDDGLSAKETGYRLGFSDPAAFSRAFKRWTGSSPSAFRARQSGG
jgi:AraC-like DNA-binding protein